MDDYDTLAAKIKTYIEKRGHPPEIFAKKSAKFNNKAEIDRINKKEIKLFTLNEIADDLIEKGINGIDIIAIIILSGILEKYEKFLEYQENDMNKIIEELGGKERLIQLAKEKLKIFLQIINEPRFLDLFDNEKFVLSGGQGYSQGSTYVDLSAGQVYRMVLKVKGVVTKDDFENFFLFVACHEFAHRMTPDLKGDDRDKLCEGFTREFAKFYSLSAEHRNYKKQFEIELEIEKKKHNEEIIRLINTLSYFLRSAYPDGIVNKTYKYSRTSGFIESRTLVPTSPYLEKNEMKNKELETYLQLPEGTFDNLKNIDLYKDTSKTVLNTVEKIVNNESKHVFHRKKI